MGAEQSITKCYFFKKKLCGFDWILICSSCWVVIPGFADDSGEGNMAATVIGGPKLSELSRPDRSRCVIASNTSHQKRQ
jgi:hypothetical protein